MKVELVSIEMKKSKAGDPAIQLVLKSENGDWIREYIGYDKAPNFVWERWGKCFGISGEAESVKVYLTQLGTAHNVLGSQCEVDCETEEYQGKEYLKVKDAKPIGVAAPTTAQDEPDTQAEVPDAEIPF